MMSWLSQYEGVLILGLTVAFTAWAYVVIWAARHINRNIGKLYQLDQIMASLALIERRITKIELHFEEKDQTFKPYTSKEVIPGKHI